MRQHLLIFLRHFERNQGVALRAVLNLGICNLWHSQPLFSRHPPQGDRHVICSPRKNISLSAKTCGGY